MAGDSGGPGCWKEKCFFKERRRPQCVLLTWLDQAPVAIRVDQRHAGNGCLFWALPET